MSNITGHIIPLDISEIYKTINAQFFKCMKSSYISNEYKEIELLKVQKFTAFNTALILCIKYNSDNASLKYLENIYFYHVERI